MNKQEQHIFWLNGLAGTGKSTIAQTFAEMAFADGKLGASFFCSRDFEDQSNLQAIFPTLAFQLAYQEPLFRKELLQVLKVYPDVGQQSLCLQMEKLIVGPLKATCIPTLIIIDALDECKDEEPASAILSILSRYTNEIPKVKFFITGRPEPRIRSGFRLESLLPITEVLKLHEVKPDSVNNDIKLFFQIHLTELGKKRSDCDLMEGWPSSSEIKILCEKAAGFFIYASTVIKFVTSKSHMPIKQLDRITSLQQCTSHEGRSGLDMLYTQVLEQAVDDVDADDEEFYSHFKTVVGAVLLVFNPLSVKALSTLLGVSGVSTTLRSLHSLLLVPTSEGIPVQVFHKSFPDFLVDKRRCVDHRFFVDPQIHHTKLLLSCLKLMREQLKKNICRLDDYAILSMVKDLSDCWKDYIGDALEYACCFWTKHLLQIPGNSPNVGEVQEAIDTFFTTCLLFWIEVLSLMGKLDIGVYALNAIQQWYTLVSCVECLLMEPMFTLVQVGVSCKWTNDSQHFLLEYLDTIHSSPSQIYHSALPLCPPSSWLYKCYTAELSQEVKVVRGLPAEWGMCSRTITFGHSPLYLTCWNNTVAVGLESGNIITLDSITGSQTAILPGHTAPVRSLAFSLEGTLLISGSDDKTIKLWDIQTGGVVKTFHGHTDCVTSVSISPDCTMIASGSKDKTICLWDIQTEESCHVIEQEDQVYHVRFSPTDSQHFISVSGSKMQRWSTTGHQTHPAHDMWHIASSDLTQVVLWEGEADVVGIANSTAGVAKFEAANTVVNHYCFSPCNRLLAWINHSVVRVFDITGSDHKHIKTLFGHTHVISSVAFPSPSSIISMSVDNSVKFWQIGVLPTNTVMTNPESAPLTSAQITSITLQAECGTAFSSDSDGVVRSWDISTGLCKASFQTIATFPCWSCIQLINSQLILVWCQRGFIGSLRWIYILDVEEGELQEVETQYDTKDARVSGDGSKVFCLHVESVQALSIQTGEVVGEVKLLCDPVTRFLAVDGSRIWVHQTSSEPLGWDFETLGTSPIQLSSIPPAHLGYAKLWDTHKSQIKDRATGKVVFQLGGRYAKPHDAQWDGQYLVAGYWSGEVLILDFNHMFL